MAYKPIWEEIMKETYNIYREENSDISFDDFFKKVMEDPNFGDYYDRVLWEQAKKRVIIKEKNK